MSLGRWAYALSLRGWPKVVRVEGIDAIAKRRFCPAGIELMRARGWVVHRGLCADYDLRTDLGVATPEIIVTVREICGTLLALLLSDALIVT